MDRDQLEYIKGNYEQLSLEVLVFARRWAFVKYGWDSRDALLGQDLEDVVMGVFQDYFVGTRNLTPGVDIVVQLRSAARSELWSLVKRKGVAAIPIVEEGDEEDTPSSYATKEPSPDSLATSSDECKTLLQLVWSHPKVKANDELAAYVLAVEERATTPAEIAEASQLPIGRVYEARRYLNGIYPEIRRKLNNIKEQPYAK